MERHQAQRRKMHDPESLTHVAAYRRDRLRYPSPAEVRFVQIMNGGALTIPFIKSKRTGFPLTFVWLSRRLKNELIEREVMVGTRCIDFGTPGARYHKGLEIDGALYHLDIVAEQERDEFLAKQGWQILHIPAKRLWREPRRVYRDVLKFLKS